MNWLSDTLRLVWSFVYWNARKSAFVWRGRTGRCPCQSPSDDNIAGRVRCTAVAHFHEPRRFHAVCPLIHRNDHGWCCRVRREEVRPFWGRALGRFALVLGAVYLVGVLVMFVVLRVNGRSQVTPWQVAWPGRWPELRRIQAEEFFQRAMVAVQAGRFNEALLALSSAQSTDPRHYPSARLLAQISMFQGSHFFADELFARMLVLFPEQRFVTAITYHDTALALARMDRVAEIALSEARADPANAARWVRSLLATLRHRPDTADFLAAHVAQVAELAPHARELLAAEQALAEGRRAEAVVRLRRRFAGPLNAAYMQAQVDRLASLGEVVEAQALLDFYGPAMGEKEHTLRQFELDAGPGGDAVAAEAGLRRLLQGKLDASLGERLAAVLVRRPDEHSLALVRQRLEGAGAQLAPEVAPMFWMAALFSGSEREVSAWRNLARSRGVELPPLVRVNPASRNLADPASILHVVNTVELPREVVIAAMGRLTPVGGAPLR